jgi:zeaxanthin glucosyltransferase
LAQIGFLSLSAAGHMNPMTTLGRSLAGRGHSVTFFCVPDLEDKVIRNGLRAITFAHRTYPIGSLKTITEKIGKLLGSEGLVYFIERMLTFAEASFEELPKLIQKQNLDMLVIDQLYPGGSTIAEHLGLPFLSVANAAHTNREDGVPPPSLLWPYDPSEAGIARNLKGWAGITQVFTPLLQRINTQRTAWNLSPYQDYLEDSFSPQLQLTQMPLGFDFPRQQAPATLHYVGPLTDPAHPSDVPFPWEWLDARPLIYASMGTLQNGIPEIFKAIIDACAGLNLQAVVSLGNGPLDPASFGELPENVLVLPYCPQAELVKRASLCITHAGLNTTLDCLASGVPMVAIPIAGDQPGVAMRIAYTGTGEVVPYTQLTAESLHAAISKVLNDSSYRLNAQRFLQEMRALNSLAEACELIENAVDEASLTTSLK